MAVGLPLHLSPTNIPPVPSQKIPGYAPALGSVLLEQEKLKELQLLPPPLLLRKLWK